MANSENTFGKNLRMARAGRSWTLEKAAEAAGTSKSYLSELERGVRPMPPGTKLQAIADALGVSIADLTRGADPTTDLVAVVGYVAAGASGATLYKEGQGPLDWVEPPTERKETTVAAEIRGVSLGPAFDNGLVFYDEVFSPVTEAQHNRLCVVGLPDGRVLVKILKAAAGGRYHLLSNTSEPPLLDELVEWAAKVKEVRPR